MSASPIRRRASRALVLAAASLIVLGGCTTAQRAPSNYSGVEDDFVQGCQTVATSDDDKVGDAGQPDGAIAIEAPKEYCQCVFDAVSDPDDGIAYDEFKKIQSRMQDEGGPLPQDYLDVLEGSNCDPSSATGTTSES